MTFGPGHAPTGGGIEAPFVGINNTPAQGFIEMATGGIAKEPLAGPGQSAHYCSNGQFQPEALPQGEKRKSAPLDTPDAQQQRYTPDAHVSTIVSSDGKRAHLRGEPIWRSLGPSRTYPAAFYKPAGRVAFISPNHEASSTAVAETSQPMPTAAPNPSAPGTTGCSIPSDASAVTSKTRPKKAGKNQERRRGQDGGRATRKSAAVTPATPSTLTGIAYPVHPTRGGQESLGASRVGPSQQLPTDMVPSPSPGPRVPSGTPAQDTANAVPRPRRKIIITSARLRDNPTACDDDSNTSTKRARSPDVATPRPAAKKRMIGKGPGRA